jgi:transcriptional regulator, tetR family
MRADAAQNRRELIETAAQLWASRGMEVSMRQIAGAAGVGVGTLYRHFPSRDDLLVAVVRQYWQRVGALTDDYLQARANNKQLAWENLLISVCDLEIGALIAQFSSVLSSAVGHELAADSQRSRERMQGVIEYAIVDGLVPENTYVEQLLLALAKISRPLPINPYINAKAEAIDTQAHMRWMVHIFAQGLAQQAKQA